MDSIKDAFLKVKKDIDLLKNEREFLRLNLAELKDEMAFHRKEILKINEFLEKLNEKKVSTGNQGVSTLRQINPSYSEQNSTDNWDFKPLNAQYPTPSTGNEGVPADRQTNQQTHRQTINYPLSREFDLNKKNPPKISASEPPENGLENAIEITKQADVLVIIGTSIQVYPAASLIHYVSSNTPIYFIDPAPSISKNTNTTIIKSGAQQGTKQLIKMLVD